MTRYRPLLRLRGRRRLLRARSGIERGGSDRVPGLILHAANDPFVRLIPETRKKIAANPNLTLVEEEDGGHCSFIADANGYDGRWAEQQVVEFLAEF